ncbi:MAG: hypothetical protein F4X98_02240 [Gammaproteobacteria bacterium]|nr:hypothetical protein [Gammaproteobacteria bacterium]
MTPTCAIRPLIAILCISGCATTPQPEQRFEVRMKIPFEFTDPCPKLATVLALHELLSYGGMPPDPDDEHLKRLKSELATRCPADVDPEPESLGLAIDFPTMACARLDAMLSMVGAFGGADLLPRRQRIVADWLVDRVNAEIDERCAP